MIDRPSPSRHRLPELDSVRGLASFAVMLHHNLLASGLIHGSLAWSLIGLTPLQSIVAGRHAVMMFFVLSGYVLSHSLARSSTSMTLLSWSGWVIERTMRLGLPALVALLMSAVLYRAFYAGTWPGESAWLRLYLWQAPPTAASIAEQGLLIRSTYRYPGDNVLWSLAQEWRLSIWLPVLSVVPALRGRGSAAWILSLGLIISLLAGGLDPSDIGIGPGILGHLRSTLYFVLPFAVGAALQRLDLARIAPGWKVYLTLALASISLCIIDSDFADYANAAIVIWLALHLGPLSRVLRHPRLVHLGRISFSLYLVHELVLAPLHHQFHTRWPELCILVLSCILSLPMAHLFHHVVESRTHRLARCVGRWFQATSSAAAVSYRPSEMLTPL